MPNIHYISPFDINRNYGDNINNAIKQLTPSDEDWIVLRDLDVAFLTPDAGNLIHDAVEKYGKEYSLIGCMANRLGSTFQTSMGMFEEMNIAEHYGAAVSHKQRWLHEVIPFRQDIAGMFMLFSVKIWRKTGGFKNSIVFDREFTKAVRMNGGKVGIMPGLYVFHAYRLWAKTRSEAVKSVEHLIK